MRVLVVAGVVLAVTPARGEVRPHVEASVWAGPAWTAQQGPGFEESDRKPILDVRGAAGVSWHSSSGIVIRGGAVLDVFTAGSGSNGAAGGIELQVDTEIEEWPGWRIGGRVAAMLGDGGGAPEAGDGQLLVPGVRLRNRFGFVGVDAILARASDGQVRRSSNAIVFGGGVSGIPAAVSLGVAGVIAGIVGLVAIQGLRHTH